MTGLRLSDLNPPQRDAVTTKDGPVLILAGAGTGKTRVITARIAYLIEMGVPADDILAVTFTNKAANEMRSRIATLISKEHAEKVTIGTFHSLSVRLLRQGIECLGYKKNFTIYAEGDQLGLIKKIIPRVSAKDEKLDPNLAKNLISRAKNCGDTPEPTDDSLLACVFRRYQDELKQLNAVDFDDLLLLAVKILREHPEQRSFWQHRFRYLLVDEFQDTNKLQLDLVRLLSSEPPNVCVVGDDDQSIYSWRGAEVSNILEFERHFKNPKIVKLEQNYRSTNAILSTANSLIKNNPRRRPKNLWSDKGDGSKIRVLAVTDDREEARIIATEIEQLHTIDGVKYEDCAVLYRMNAQSRLLEENLRERKIPYRLIGGKSFFDRREVKDLIAYGNVLLNPQDDVSLLRIINNPPRGIGAATVERALELSVRNSTSLFQALADEAFLADCAARTRQALHTFYQLIDRYETRLHEPLADQAAVLGDLLAETSYMEELKRGCATPEEALNREANINDLLGDLRTHCGRSRTGLRDYLDRLTLDREKEEDKEQTTGVTLITLHAAKGLEFPHVYLIGLEEGLIPHERSKLEGTVEEERRLFYVGITRAIRSLTMTRCQTRTRYGQKVHCHPSSFIKELAPDHLDICDYAEMQARPVPRETALDQFARLKAMLRASAGG